MEEGRPRTVSAGRVQSVAVRIVVEREREIDIFVPDESWSVEALLALDPEEGGNTHRIMGDFITTTDAKGKGPTIKVQNAWLAEHGGLKTELVELGGTRFNLGCSAESPVDLSAEITEVAEAVGMKKISVDATEKNRGKGPARFQRTLQGDLDPKTRYAVKSTETKRTTSRAYAPFITSTLQQNAANSWASPPTEPCDSHRACMRALRSRAKARSA